MRHWLNVSSLRSWRVEVDAEKYMIGGVAKRLTSLSKIRPGDLIAEYLSKGAQSFVAILRATSYVYEDQTQFWPHGLYPFRVNRDLVLTAPKGSFGCPGRDLARRLEFVRNKSYWGRYLQVKIREISETDMSEIRSALESIGGESASVAIAGLSKKEKAANDESLAATSKGISQIDRVDVRTPAGGLLYEFYRSRGLGNSEARTLEEVHFLLSQTNLKHGDVIDVLADYNFLVNELVLGHPTGVIAERIGKLEAEKASLLVAWARLSSMAQMLDLDKLRSKLQERELFPSVEL